MRDMRPSKAELKQAFMPMLRGTLSAPCSARCRARVRPSPRLSPTRLERRLSKQPERFGQGALEGVAAPEAASH